MDPEEILRLFAHFYQVEWVSYQVEDGYVYVTPNTGDKSECNDLKLCQMGWLSQVLRYKNGHALAAFCKGKIRAVQLHSKGKTINLFKCKEPILKKERYSKLKESVIDDITNQETLER